MKRYLIKENHITYDIKEFPNGSKYYLLNGTYHREDGPALEHQDGTKEWYKNGLKHREGGPAFEDSNGYRAWYKNGKRHRSGGPAIEFASGEKQYWYNGKYLEHVNSDKELIRYIRLLSIS